MSADDFGGKISNPQTLNLYAYALNNPIKWVDPTGHSPEEPCPTCETRDGKLFKDGKPYVLPREGVTVRGHGRDLPSSHWDLIPVIGLLRRAAWNINCEFGGCNVNRALGNLALTAVDGGTLAAPAKALYGAAKEGLSWVAGKLFAKEVTEETTEAVGQTAIRTVAEDSMENSSTLYHYTDETSAAAIQESQLGRGGNIYLTNNGSLSPLQSQIELALPPGNTGRAVFAVDAGALNPSNLVRTGRVTGNVFNRAGGGAEFVYNQTVPRSALTRIK